MTLGGWVSGHRRRTDLFDQRALYLNFIWHVEVIETMLPWELLDDIGPKQVEANEQQCSKAFFVTDVNEVGQELFGNLRRARDWSCDHGVFVELVLLWQRYRLLPAWVFLSGGKRKAQGFGNKIAPCRDEQPSAWIPTVHAVLISWQDWYCWSYQSYRWSHEVSCSLLLQSIDHCKHRWPLQCWTNTWDQHSEPLFGEIRLRVEPQLDMILWGERDQFDGMSGRHEHGRYEEWAQWEGLSRAWVVLEGKRLETCSN